VENFIITLLICSVAMSGIGLLYMACTPFLAKRFCEKGRYYAWLIIIIGLIIPFRPQ
jgi:beta-lactamase regulating signal transducer with metallopeptidase domain